MFKELEPMKGSDGVDTYFEQYANSENNTLMLTLMQKSECIHLTQNDAAILSQRLAQWLRGLHDAS